MCPCRNCIVGGRTKWRSGLEYLGVDSKTAADDACRIEHVISAESFDAIKKHIKR